MAHASDGHWSWSFICFTVNLSLPLQYDSVTEQFLKFHKIMVSSSSLSRSPVLLGTYKRVLKIMNLNVQHFSFHDHLFLKKFVWTFDCCWQTGTRPCARRASFPHFPVIAENTLSSTRLTAFLLYGMWFSFNHLMYIMFPQSFVFIKKKLQCFSCFFRLCYIVITSTSLILEPKLVFYIANGFWDSWQVLSVPIITNILESAVSQ